MTVVAWSGACQRTLLAQAPTDDRDCDARLLGHWVSQAGNGTRAGEVEATVSPACGLVLRENSNDGTTRVWPQVTLATTRAGRRDLLWLDAGAANHAFAVEPGAMDRDGSVYAFAYELRDGELSVLPPAHRHFARRIAADVLDGAAFVEGADIVVRLDGKRDELVALLGERRSFVRGDAVRFRRADGVAQP